MTSRPSARFAHRLQLAARLLVTCLALLAPLVTGARPALAQSARVKAQAQARYKEGMKLFNLGRFPDAIQEFERAYELDAAPVHLFNIAQAHLKSGNPTQARFFYQRYLAEAPDGPKRKAAEERIAEIDLAAQRAQASAVQPPRGDADKPPAIERPVQASPRPEPAQALTARPAEAEGRSDGSTARYTGYGLIGLGAASVAGGVVYLLAGRGGCGSLPTGAMCNTERRSAVPGFVLAGAGLAAGVVGGILVYSNRDAGIGVSFSDGLMLVVKGSLR
jgi:tetratricopeptide (TPR) repeat protein